MAGQGILAKIGKLKKPAGGRASIAAREAVRQGGATLNIGLKVGEEVALSADEVLEAVMAAGGKVSEFRIVESGTEPTVVIQLSKPIDKRNLYRLSEGLQQEAIAQRFADGTGEIVGPNAEAWGAFNPDEFRPINYRGVFEERKASELAPTEQAALERRTPAQIAAEEKAIAAGKEPRQAKTPPIMSEIDTPENRARIMGLVEQGRAKGADAWYHSGGIKDKFIEVLGPEQGPAAFDEFMALKAATSPRSTVDQNLRRASVPYQSSRQGGRLDLSADEFPEGTGHMAHTTAHLPALRRLQETGRLGDPWQQQKITSYFENLRGNYTPVTSDTHNFQIWTGHNRSPTQAQYKAIERMQQEMAAELGMDPAEFQSALWAGAGDITGVANVQNITPAMNERVANTARNLGVSEDEAARRFIRGDTRLYSQAGLPAAGIGAGILAMPGEESSAMAAPVGPIVGQGRRAAAGAARGARTSQKAAKIRTPETFQQGVDDIMYNLSSGQIDHETALNRILEDIGELDRIKPGLNRNFTPENKAAVSDYMYDAFQRLQKTTDADRPAVFNKTGDIPGDMMPESGMQQMGEAAAAATPRGDRVFRHEETQFDPFSFMDDPLSRELPTEQFGALMDEGRQLAQIERSMRQPPESFLNPGLATGRFIEDPYDKWSPPKPEEGRIYSPEEIEAENARRGLPTAAGVGALAVAGTAQGNAGVESPGARNTLNAFFEATNPHPSKQLEETRGALGITSVLDSDAEDPGILAAPTMVENNGRVTERASAGELLRERNNLGRVGEALAAVPEFGMDILRQYGGMIGGGLAGIASLPFEVGASLLQTGGIDQGINRAADRVTGVQDWVGRPQGEDAISGELANLLSHPAVMEKIQQLMDVDLQLQDEAYDRGRGSYVGYHALTRLPMNL